MTDWKMSCGHTFDDYKQVESSGGMRNFSVWYIWQCQKCGHRHVFANPINAYCSHIGHHNFQNGKCEWCEALEHPPPQMYVSNTINIPWTQ